MNIKKYHNFTAVLMCSLALILVITTLVPVRTAQANVSPASTPVAVYGDSLAAGWQDWSWDTTRSLVNTSPRQSGTYSIAVTYTKAWAGLYLHRGTALSTSGYTHLEFYIHGGTSGGQRIQVIANSNTGKAYPVTAAAGQWTLVSIPLSSLGSPASLTDLYWQDAKGVVQPKYYLDAITLVDRGSTSPTATRPAPTATKPAPTGVAPTATRPAPTATAKPTSTPVPTGKYFTTLPPGSALPSDAECAAAVKRRPENKGINAAYNATVGGQGLGSNFFSGDDARANSQIAPRVTGNFTGTTDEILQWTACKWGIDEDIVRAQAAVESWWRMDTKGDWTTDATRCSPGHGLGVDGTAGQCPESWGILQNRYPYEQSAWPGIQKSTAFNADTAYAIWRVCYEGYEGWLNTVDRGSQYAAGDAWGCVGRWYAGRWHTQAAEDYISRVKNYQTTRVWESASFQQP